MSENNLNNMNYGNQSEDELREQEVRAQEAVAREDGFVTGEEVVVEDLDIEQNTYEAAENTNHVADTGYNQSEASAVDYNTTQAAYNSSYDTAYENNTTANSAGISNSIHNATHSNYGGYNYTGYSNYNTANQAYSQEPEQSYEDSDEEAIYYQEEPRKKPSVLARILGISAAGLLFGTVAGGTMFGINHFANSVSGTKPVVESGLAETTATKKVELKEATDGIINPVTQSAAVPDVSHIAESFMPSVVAIQGTASVEAYSFFGGSYDAPSSGSGIIIGENDTELLIVTNNHVVAGTKDLNVLFIDDKKVPASLKGNDEDNDIAIIAVKLEDIEAETREKISIATMGDSEAVKVGQGVVAIGNALGYGQSVTVGYISALNRSVSTRDSSIENLLQTDAAINPGNSGGALINMAGELIGINTAKYASTEVEGMGYAIPITKVKDIIAELSNRGTKVAEEKQGYLGIQGKNIDASVASAYDMPRGVYIYKIVEGGAADNSELQERDIITKLNAQTVKTMEELKEALEYHSSGETVNLTIQRLEDNEYKEMLVEVTLSDHSSLQ